MSLFLAVIGATAAALLEVVPYFTVGDAHPHPVLVFGVIWVVAAGLEKALAWGVIGGIVLDALSNRPLGSSAFALLVSMGGAAVLGRSLVRIRPLVPVVAVALMSGVNSMIQIALYSAARSPISVADPLDALLPGIAYDTVLALLLGPLIVAIHDRFADQERLDW